MGSIKRRGLALIGWIITFLALVSGAVVLTCLCAWLIYPLINQWGHLAKAQQLTTGQLMANFNRLMRYLLIPGGQLELPNFAMSLNGQQHFSEVKRLFLSAEIIGLITGPLAVWRWQQYKVAKRLWQYIAPLQISLIVPIIVGFVASMNFERFFIIFHQILFRNLDWQFDPLTDPIILVLPEFYFAICFAIFFGLLEGSFSWLLWRAKRTLVY